MAGAAIHACGKGRRWGPALGLLNDCKTCSTPDAISHNAAISACAKGCWELTLERLNECKTWSAPNTTSYNAAISACEKKTELDRFVICYVFFVNRKWTTM